MYVFLFIYCVPCRLKFLKTVQSVDFNLGVVQVTEKLWFYKLATCGEFLSDEVINIVFETMLLLCTSKLVQLFLYIWLNDVTFFFFICSTLTYVSTTLERRLNIAAPLSGG